MESNSKENIVNARLEDKSEAVFIYKAGNKHFGFSGYTDPETGEDKYLWDGGYNKDGTEKRRDIYFSRKHKFFKVKKNQRDKNGQLIWEYVRDFPFCKQSPHNNGKFWYYEMLDPEGDATEAIKAKELRAEATNMVFQSTKSKLHQVGSILGIRGTDSYVTFNLLEIADNDPQKIIGAMQDPELDARATVYQALDQGIFTKKGFMIMFNKMHLGNDESQAAKKLADDKELLKNVKDALKD